MQRHEDGSVRIWQSYVWSKNGESFFVSTCYLCEGLESMQTVVCRYDHVKHKCGEALFLAEGLWDHAQICQWIAESDNPVEFVKKSLDQSREVKLILRKGGYEP